MKDAHLQMTELFVMFLLLKINVSCFKFTNKPNPQIFSSVDIYDYLYEDNKNNLLLYSFF